MHRGFAEFFPRFFEGGEAGPRKIEEKIEANPEVHTKNHGFFFWGGLKTRTIWEVFQSAIEVFLSVRGLRRFFLSGTPKKKRPGSRKTSHIVWVLLPQPSFPSARPITKPSQKNKTLIHHLLVVTNKFITQISCLPILDT